jgi:hypothetical protein
MTGSQRLIGVLAFVVLAVQAGQADARPAHRITLRVGDSFVVAGTSLACTTQVGTHVIKGKKLVTCFKVNGNDLWAKSYVVALGENGRVVVAPVGTKSAIGAPIFDRTPAGVGSAGRQLTARAGDEFRLAGTNVFCVVNNDASGTYPTCFRGSSRGAVPGSYGFAETNRFVAVVKFDSAGKRTQLVLKRAHGG